MTYPPLTLGLDPFSDRFTVHAKFAHKDDMATIPGATFKGNGQDFWTMPRRWLQVTLLDNIFGDAVEWTPEAAKWAHDEFGGSVGPAMELRHDHVDPEVMALMKGLSCPERPLFDYQVTGALFLATARRAHLFDEMGTGKMIQGAFALSVYPETLPALIVCPNSVLFTWQAELRLFGIESVVIPGTDAAVKRRAAITNFDPELTPVMIVGYSTLSKHTRVAGYGTIKLSDEDKRSKELNAIPWSCVIADEVHRVKDPRSLQTRALWAVSASATFRWGLTGTPIEADFMDTWSLMHFVDPEEWPSVVRARDRWAQQHLNFFGGLEILGLRPDTEAEYHDVLDWHWRRQLMDRANLPPQLPTEFRYCQLSGSQAKAYRDMSAQLMAVIGDDDAVLFAENHMVKAGRLLQMASSTIEFAEGTEDVVAVEPSAKLDLMMETLADCPQPCILWFKHRKLLHLAEARLLKAGIGHVVIHGGVSPQDRHNNVAAFQAGDVDRILIVMAAGSEGVTLTRAPLAIYVERDWSFIKNTQATGRNFRIGSEIHDEIRTINLVTMDTIEQALYEVLDTKAETAELLLRDQRKLFTAAMRA